MDFANDFINLFRRSFQVVIENRDLMQKFLPLLLVIQSNHWRFIFDC
jgi:hypothetical protein